MVLVLLLQKLLRLRQFRTVHWLLPSLSQFEADLIDDPVTIAQQLHVGRQVVQRLTVDQNLRKQGRSLTILEKGSSFGHFSGKQGQWICQNFEFLGNFS